MALVQRFTVNQLKYDLYASYIRIWLFRINEGARFIRNRKDEEKEEKYVGKDRTKANYIYNIHEKGVV